MTDTEHSAPAKPHVRIQHDHQPKRPVHPASHDASRRPPHGQARAGARTGGAAAHPATLSGQAAATALPGRLAVVDAWTWPVSPSRQAPKTSPCWKSSCSPGANASVANACWDSRRETKFGMFIHWGVYSLLQDDAWVMNTRRLRMPEYETLAPQFDPTRFDAAAWVALAKAAGARYITFTAKHHDGFAMFDRRSATGTSWTHAVPPRRGARAGRRVPAPGHPAVRLLLAARLAPPRLLPARRHRPENRASRSRETGIRYLDFIDAQLTELLTSYGQLGGVWFDGSGISRTPTGGSRTYRLIHDLQPGGADRAESSQRPVPGEDLCRRSSRTPRASNTAGLDTRDVGGACRSRCR